MPLDALCLSAAAAELRAGAVGARIDKIHQPAREELVLSLYRDGENRTLLLAGGGVQPRAHFTAVKRENPAQAPMFCMLLRRHLTGGRILSVSQPPMERVLLLAIEAVDELGVKAEKTLVLEALGKQGNVILCGGDGRILDCVRRLEGDPATGRRALLPGMFYRMPPMAVKENPLTVTREEFSRLLTAAPDGRPCDAWLVETFGGLSPLLARELAHRAAGEGDAAVVDCRAHLSDVFFALMGSVRGNYFTPNMLLRGGEPADFSFTEIAQYGEDVACKPFPSFAALFDTFFAERERVQHMRQRGADLLRAVESAKTRTARRLENQSRERAETEGRERLRELGDLLTSNLHVLEKGQGRARVLDYYDPAGKEAEIQLDPLLTPQQNAARYYKRYQKAKTAAEVLAEQITRGAAELVYLDSVAEALTRAETEADLSDIRRELEETGYLKAAKGGKKKRSAKSAGPITLCTASGLTVQVGRNNLQNDLLTKTAGKDDLWLHVQGIHGAHVILRTGGGVPDPASIEEAAQIAARYSQAKPGVKTAVDYTPVKFVKKPAGSRPGFVVYTRYETILVIAP